MKKRVFLILASVWFIIPNVTTGSPIKHDERVIFFSTNAVLSPGGEIWAIPIHGWIFEKEAGSFWRKMSIDGLSGILEVEPDETSRPIYEERTQMFLVDNERGKEIEIELSGKRSTLDSSKENGHFYGVVNRDRKRMGDQTGQKWITFRAVTQKRDRRIFQGKAQLIGPQGISVISDIDDTIKISNVKNKKALLKNTFLKVFSPVPGMVDVYRNWDKEGAVFHYLSASPWHLYPALSGFISNSGFPDGSYNLKNFRVKDESFFNLFSSQEEYKKPIIEKLLKKYPGRRFILVGDAGEEDPEIFAKVARLYPQQILHVFIRDQKPGSAQSNRFKRVFEGIPESRWTIFREGSDLLDFEITRMMSLQTHRH